jgi:S-adenosylmethionine:tRNA ribosyltransferase-isomerase
MRTADFHYYLPPELIAQEPAPRRDSSRLLVLHRQNGLEHRQFPDFINYLKKGDVLVVNNSRVIPARMWGKNAKFGGKFEVLLLEENSPNDWWAMLRPGKRARLGTQILFSATDLNSKLVSATVTDINDQGHRRLTFSGTANILDDLNVLGEMPLPNYISKRDSTRDKDRYQTIFAQPPGSVAAPTAGLHFTPALLNQIRAIGVQICPVTLHVGPGTFAPVKAEELSGHQMHAEKFELTRETVTAVNEAKKNGCRVIAVGTTSVRALESVAALNEGKLNFYRGKTQIFLHPPHRFHIVDALLTNFHLPASTLLMLVSAFAAPGELTAGRDKILSAYREAIQQRYRFFSYGDAMLLL